MKKSLKGLMYVLVLVVGVFALTGCGKNNFSSNNENSSNSKMSNDIIKVDGVYLNNEYTDEDGLKQIVLFYTLLILLHMGNTFG